MYADVFWVLKIMFWGARSRNISTYIFFVVRFGVLPPPPPNTKKLATLLIIMIKLDRPLTTIGTANYRWKS